MRATQLGVGQRHAGPDDDLPRRRPAGLRPDLDDPVARTAAWARAALDDGLLDLPLPGRGATAERFAGLADLGTVDLDLARLAEAHADAVAIRADLGRSPDRATGCGGSGRRTRRPTRCRPAGTATGWLLDGTKPWCSGAGLLRPRPGHGPHRRRLPALRRRPRRARRDAGGRHLAGGGDAGQRQPLGALRATSRRSRSAARTTTCSRPGFWHGAVGVAAVWWGGARGVARALARADARRPLNPHALAHAGAVDAALAAALGRRRRGGGLLRRRPRRRDGPDPAHRRPGPGRRSSAPRPRSSNAPAGRSGPRRWPSTPTTAGGWPTSGCTSGRAMPSATSRSSAGPSLDAGALPVGRPGRRDHDRHRAAGRHRRVPVGRTGRRRRPGRRSTSTSSRGARCSWSRRTRTTRSSGSAACWRCWPGSAPTCGCSGPPTARPRTPARPPSRPGGWPSIRRAESSVAAERLGLAAAPRIHLGLPDGGWPGARTS